MKRSMLAVWVWYRGDRFRGFQRQVQGPTVQGELARALTELGLASGAAPAGRTDLGVHARMQVVGVRVPRDLEPGELAERLGKRLPEGLGLCLAVRPPRRFHPQWRCAGKEYRYRLTLGAAPRGWKPFAWDVSSAPRLEGRSPRPEQVDELLRASVGRRDFQSFHEKTSAIGPRTLSEARLVEVGPGLFEARLRGDRFGRYQVRYLVGSAVAAAAGVIGREAFAAALDEGAKLEGLKAPGQGLVLWEVFYPPEDDPFTAGERAAPPGLPDEPPFSTVR